MKTKSQSWAFGLVSLTLALGAAACGGSDTSSAKKNSINRIPIPDSQFKPTDMENTISNLIAEIDKVEPKQLQLSVILKALVSYWEPVRTGTSRAFGELQVNGTLTAPTEDSDDGRTQRQITTLMNQRALGYAGFGIAPMAEAVADQINAAADAGIPVITFDSDLADSRRQLYVGTINEQAGTTGAQTLLSFLTGKSSGTILILGHDTADDWPDGYNRTMAAKTAFEAAGFTVMVRRSTWTVDGGQTDTDALTAMIQTANPPVVGMLGVFSNAFRCADAAVAAGAAAGDIKIAAFDFEAETLSYMQSGMIQATHAQRQYYMGYILPYALYGMNVLGIDKTKSILAPQMVDNFRFNTGLDVVHADQLDAYNAFLDSLGIGG